MIFSIFKTIIYMFIFKSFIVSGNDLNDRLDQDYEDEKNSMIAVTETEVNNYDYFYDEFDNRIKIDNSMDVIFFGPPSYFLRLDTETILHIFLQTKKHMIPVSRTLLAWDIITDGKTAAFLQDREFIAFDNLLEYVPEEDLYFVNFGDSSVFKYFSTHKINLSNRKYGVLVAAYKRYYGDDWYLNGTHINELGYLLCGFPSFDLLKISPKTFRELNVDVLSKLDRCSMNQTKTLYNIAIHTDAYGYPYEWSSHDVGRLNKLITCISNEDISSIPLEAISAITSKVLRLMDQKKLRFFTKQQILRMSPNTRRIYMLRVQLMNSLDTSQITKNEARLPKLNYIILLLLTAQYL